MRRWLCRSGYVLLPMMIHLALSAFLTCSVVQPASGAAPSAAMSYELGVQAFNRGDFREALKLLQDAVSEDPENLDHQYMLGIAYMRMQRHDEAESIYLALLQADESRFQKVWFDLAVINIQKGREEEALVMLGKAKSLDPGRAEYEAGAIHMRLRDYRRAAEAFNQAAALKPELASHAVTQQAIAEFHQKNLKEAKTLLKKVLSMKLPEERAEEVRKLLESIETASRATKPWRVSATLGVQYDDNVVQNPLDAVNLAPRPRRATDEEDVAFLASFSGRYSFLQKEPWEVGVGYNHYQLTYADHSDMNLIGAVPSIYAQWEKAPYAGSLEYMFGHFWVDGESRVDVHSLFPRFVMTHGNRWRTEAIGGMEWRLYDDETPDDRLYRAGVTEMYLLREGKAHFRVGFLTSYDDMVPEARGDYWTHEALVGLQWPLWRDRWFADLSGRYIWRNFEFDSNISPEEERDDEEQNLSVQVSGLLTSYLQMTFLFQHIWNDSNIVNEQNFDPFHYRRAVYTCMFTFFY